MPYSQQQLNLLNKYAEENVEKILKHFNLHLQRLPGRFSGSCPIHKGDSPSAFNYNLNVNKNWRYSSWKCFTHNCHKVFADNTIGLVRGLLSSECEDWRGIGDRLYSFGKTLGWLERFLGTKYGDIVCEEKNEGGVERQFEIPKPSLQLTRAEIRGMMGRKSKYFVERGYNPDLLDSFDVGSPLKPIPKYYFREFVPVYDHKNEYCIGAIARSVFEKCPKCKAHHDPTFSCPKQEFARFYCKWKQWEFNRAYSLYNLGEAQKSIWQTRSVILVEGTGSVWKLKEAGIYNVVASYGTVLSYGQKELLKRCGADYLWMGFDNDKAGDDAAKVLGRELWPDFYLRKLSIPQEYNDIGEINNPSWLHSLVNKQLRIK